MSSDLDLDPDTELRLVSGLRDVTAEAMAELVGLVVQRRVRARELVATQGQVAQGLVLLVRGAVKSVRTSRTKEGEVTRVLDVTRASAIIPDASALDALPSEASIVALRASHVFVVERRALQRAMGTHPTLARALFARFVREVRDSARRLDVLASGSVEERIHGLLESLSLLHGTPLGNGRFIPLPLRRHDLASMVNATTETVSRLLAKLEREGRARSTRDGIWWKNAPKRASSGLSEAPAGASSPPPAAKAGPV